MRVGDPAVIAARMLPMGEEAVLIEVDDIGSVVVLHAALEKGVRAGAEPWHAVQDMVPAARTILLVAPGCADLSALGNAAVTLAGELDEPGDISAAAQKAGAAHDDADAGADAADDADTRVVTIPVTYDGEDLDDIAAATGMTHEEIIEAHTGASWTVAFFGFAPGFAYLAGGDPRLRVPRRDDPRTSVPSGAVGLAGEFSAIYPRTSPGGWQLLGHTDQPMWDVTAEQPSRLQPGDQVRFVVAGDHVVASDQ